LYPLLPIGRALREQGHAVAVITSASMAEVVAAEGFELLPAGPGIAELIPPTLEAHPELAAEIHSMRAAVPLFADTRVQLTLPDALVAGAWRPDMVISEHADFVGPLLGAILGAQRVTLGFGPGHPADWLDLATDAVAPHYRAEGLLPPAGGGLYQGMYLDSCPPSLQAPGFPRPTRSWPIRSEAYRAPWATTRTAPDFGKRANKPLVLLTMGTIFGKADVFSAALAALTDMDVNVLVTVGPLMDPSAISADPSRVRVERFVPIDLVLDRCDLVVAHGGAGTVLAALARGVPLVLIPQATDQFINAERAVAAGAGLTLDPTEFNIDSFKLAIQRVAGEPKYAAAARRIRAEIEAMPTPRAVATDLAAFTERVVA
jgi:UDP:flavonoid glycosyltransferase YjiC (YdhE family)